MKTFFTLFAAFILIVGGIFFYGRYVKKNAALLQNASTTIQIATSTGQSSTVSTSTQVVSGYTLAQIAQHNTQNSCWMAIDGNVYDVTSFISGHPGGQAILRGCGTDASVIYANIHDERARSLLPQFKIGPVR